MVRLHAGAGAGAGAGPAAVLNIGRHARNNSGHASELSCSVLHTRRRRERHGDRVLPGDIRAVLRVRWRDDVGGALGRGADVRHGHLVHPDAVHHAGRLRRPVMPPARPAQVDLCIHTTSN